MGIVAGGLLTLVAGLLLCFGGYIAMRLMLALWGGYVGLVAGGIGYALVTGGQPFTDGWSWLAPLITAVLFALLAYAFYAAAVIISVGGLGYALGLGIAAAMGLGGGATVVVGIVAAVLLAWLAMAARLPHLILAVLSAIAGAGIAVSGLMLLTGAVDAGAAGPAFIEELMFDQWWWGVGYVALAIAGIVSQLRSGRRRDIRSAYPAQANRAEPQRSEP